MRGLIRQSETERLMITGKMGKLRCSHEWRVVSQIIYSRCMQILKFLETDFWYSQ